MTVSPTAVTTATWAADLAKELMDLIVHSLADLEGGHHADLTLGIVAVAGIPAGAVANFCSPTSAQPLLPASRSCRCGRHAPIVVSGLYWNHLVRILGWLAV